MRRNERPLKRINPSGETVWLARWSDRTGRRRYGRAPEIKGTYKLRREAQEAIFACYAAEDASPTNPSTVGGYFETWTAVHPRARVTDRTNEYRVKAMLDVKVDGAPFRDWPFEKLRRRHANLLVDHMLRVDGRARVGALNVIQTIALMIEDAVEDEAATLNPFRGVKIRPNDPRIQKESRPVRVFSWEDMHRFARAAAVGEGWGPEIVEWRRLYAEPMVRVLSDCGLRIGELFGLRRQDLDLTAGLLEVRQTVSKDGEILQGTKTDHHRADAGRVVPIPPDLCEMLREMPKRIDTPLLFTSSRGRPWLYDNYKAMVWMPACEVAGIDPRPHEFRHSWVSLIRAAGVDPADLAEASGHSVETATAKYTHALGRSYEAIRKAVG